MTDNYEIGYCKPPQGTRFKAGQSGNGKGRPKGRKKEDIMDLLNKELKSKLILKDGNKITKETAMLRQLCNKASSGDYRSGKLILDVSTKQQINTLAVEFLERLIREDYITEKSVKNYLRSGSLLEMETMPRALYELYKYAETGHTKAWMSVIGVLRLMYVWQNYSAVVYINNILSAMHEELAFWKGFEKALDYLQIDEERRKELIAKAEEGRYYKRPSEQLLKIAVDTHIFALSAAMQIFINMRNIYKKAEGYEDAEEKWYSKEHLNFMHSEIKEEKECEYEDLKKSMEQQEIELADFNKISLKTKEFKALREKLKKEDIGAIFTWYVSDSKKG